MDRIYSCPGHEGESAKKSDVHPGRLTWNLKMMVWKMIFLFNWVIFRFHVNLPGCNSTASLGKRGKLFSSCNRQPWSRGSESIRSVESTGPSKTHGSLWLCQVFPHGKPVVSPSSEPLNTTTSVRFQSDVF